MHKPIQIESLELSFPHKICFAEFNEQILSGARIAIIGRNGSGKSTLLKLLAGFMQPTDGDIYRPTEINIGYVPQVIEEFDSLSGGQRFNKLLTQALKTNPEILMLDEPTNHLDRNHRHSLMRMLAHFNGTLILVTHDIELLKTTVNTIWHIDQGQVNVFSGHYDDYLREIETQRSILQNELTDLTRQKKQIHTDMMKEQVRAKNSRIKGEKSIQQRKWPTVVSKTKAGNAQENSGRKKSLMNNQKQELSQRLSALHIPEVINPKFSLSGLNNHQTVATIDEGSISYKNNHPILRQIRFAIKTRECIAIQGENGSGKTTFLKAILRDPKITKKGLWNIPDPKEIGYLDQHYTTLNANKTVFETIHECLNNKSYPEIRSYLNDFLFRKNEEVEALVSTLSGGEKVRLSLAQIAAITPKLLILDELTNNLDRETRAYVIEVLKAYPGAIIVVSHDSDFLKAIKVMEEFEIKNGILQPLITYKTEHHYE